MRIAGNFVIAISILCSITAFAQSGDGQTAVATGVSTPQDTRSIEINSAATVALVEGDASIISPDNRSQSAKVGDAINEGDTLVTGKDGEIHLEMQDGGYIALRPNTKMRFTKYQARGDDNDTSVISLVQGSLRAVSGWIGRFNMPRYVITTPTATIGLRGTDHEPLVIPQGVANPEGEPGTYDKVNIGASTITTMEGKAEVEAGQAGFVGHDHKAPRILKDTPEFYRKTRNEKLLDGKHGEIQHHLSELRDARKAAIK